MARCAPGHEPRSHRRERVQDRLGPPRNGDARLLVALQEDDEDGVTAVAQTSAPHVDLSAAFDRAEVEQFLYREARLADESDYDAWEALWTDDALYWVPVASTDDPLQKMSVIYDNRSRIATRLKQIRTGKRYAQSPPSNLRRLLSNIEFLGGRT